MYAEPAAAVAPRPANTGPRWRSRVAAAGCVALLALAACSGDDDAAPNDPGDGPLAEYLGYGLASDLTGRGPAEISEADRQAHYEVEERIAECMAGEGFDYVPVSLDDQMSGGFMEAYELEPADFAEQYGYGITTLGMGDDRPQPPPDPNEEIRDALSDAAQEEYQRAMWGDMSSLEPDEDGVIQFNPDDLDPEDRGCRHLAEREVHGEPGGDEGMRQFDTLFEDFGQLYERLENDSRMDDAHRAWAECMTEAGFDEFTVPHDAQQSVYERTSEIFGGAPGPGETDEAPATPSPGQQPGQPDPDQLAEVRDHELAVAPADHACQQEHVAGPRAEVAHELEAEFVEQHREALEEFRNWRDEE